MTKDKKLKEPILSSTESSNAIDIPTIPEILPDVSIFEILTIQEPLDVILMFFGFIAAVVTGASIPTFNVLMGQLINEINDENTGFGSSITLLVHALLALAFINLCSGTVQIYCWSCNGERQTDRLREKYVNSILRQEIGWFDTCGASELSTRVAELCGQVQDGLGRKLGDMQQYFFQTLAAFGAAFYLSWELTIVLLGTVPFIGLAGWFMIDAITAAQNDSLDQYSAAGGTATEALNAIRTVSALNAQPLFLAKYRRFLVDAMKIGIAKGRKVGFGNGLLFCVCFLTYALGFWYGAKLIADDIDDRCTTRCATGGKIVSVFFCVIMGSVGVGQMIPPMNAVFTAKAAAAKMLLICNRKPLIDGLSDEGDIIPTGISGQIELRDISFAYPSRPNTLICKNYNLMVEPGQVLALCGMSGCGKSTIINLLLRFYDPQHGEVLIDGRDSRQMNVRWLRSKIGYVGQEPVLFSGTIADNIAYGLDLRYENHLTDEDVLARVYEAAKLSNAHDFISLFPSGYNTSVGTNGVALSGGQKQRIAIARALVKRPAILLLDEATSALDAASEQMVQQSIDSLQQSRAQTTIIIAHRLSTIRNADKIALIADGTVAELGNHDDLIALNGKYADLVRLQMTTTGAPLSEVLSYSQHPPPPPPLTSPFPPQSSTGPKYRSFGSAEEIPSSPHERVLSINNGQQTHVIAQGLLNASRSLSFSEEPPLPPPPTTVSTQKNNEKIEFTSEEKKILNKRIWGLILQHKGWLFIGLLGAAIFGTVFPLWGYILAKAQNMFFYSNTDKMRRRAVKEALYFVGLGIASLFSCTLQYWGIAQVGERISARLRSDLFESYMRRGIKYFDQTENSAGELCTRLSNDSRLVHKAGGEALAKQLQALFTLIVGCIIGFSASWRIAAVVIACFPANIIASAIQMQAISGQQYDTEIDDDGQVALLSSAFTNMRTVAAFSMQYTISDKYSKLAQVASTGRMNRAFVAGLGFGASNMSLFLTYTLLFWYGQRLMNHGKVDFMDMMTAIFSLMLGALGIGQALIDLGDQDEGLAAARRIFHALDEAKLDPLDGLSTNGICPTEPCRGVIKIENVTFSYPTRKEVIVCKNFSLTIASGEVIAIVGPSGSGKSTIMSLLLRFYDPLEGQILIDGKSISSLNIRWLRSQIGYVGQEPILFNETIQENVKMGLGMEKTTCPTLDEFIKLESQLFKKNKGVVSNQTKGVQKSTNRAMTRDTIGLDETSVSETSYLPPHFYDNSSVEGGGGGGGGGDVETGNEELLSQRFGVDLKILQACRTSNAHEFISRFPDRYDTNVGEGSIMISGGQKQRIAIARALVKRPAILLLDEATSALDAASEQMVQQSIDSLQQSRAQTTIIIAHRLSTIRNADRILVVDKGEVVEMGTHDTLLAKGGLYSVLWNKQQGFHAED